ncbi:hypothetical protein K3N28_12815 [Glycomyces sp. TRM65418]|uniref:hypothetical protein n=1 Tax=Glycomyces sp. TRM65418 TaxID=2867006 RepID=UPI001CE600AC|nr:hypothetical protein [Glycomyces sp. TRM65418]MCC3763947.1 hypothetical protein [Glycomyces sp. TRM65418]QZD53647.1 hypothetical protein K3N28_12745 [Glycomyces sp. TRM65418]
MRLWTLRFSAALAPVPVVELFGVHRLWGYGLIYPAMAATWATGRWQRRRQLARLRDAPAPGRGDPRTGFWDEAAEGRRRRTATGTLDDACASSIGVAVSASMAAGTGAPGERRARAMSNLVGSIKDQSLDADLRIQLIQDLVDLGGRDMALCLSPVAIASEVDVEVRLEAAEHMSRFCIEEAARALEAIAADATVEDKYRLDAASALADCAARPAGAALMQLVTDDSVSEYVRHSAANTLCRVDRSAAAVALRHLANAPVVTARLRIICAEQLADDNALDAEDALWRLIKGVESVMDYHLGIDAAEAMHGISPEVGIEAYSVLAVDSCFPWFGRIEAAYRLGRLGVRDGFDLLSDFARAEDLEDVYGLAALDRLFQLEVETGTLGPEE